MLRNTIINGALPLRSPVPLAMAALDDLLEKAYRLAWPTLAVSAVLRTSVPEAPVRFIGRLHVGNWKCVARTSGIGSARIIARDSDTVGCRSAGSMRRPCDTPSRSLSQCEAHARADSGPSVAQSPSHLLRMTGGARVTAETGVSWPSGGLQASVLHGLEWWRD